MKTNNVNRRKSGWSQIRPFWTRTIIGTLFFVFLIGGCVGSAELAPYAPALTVTSYLPILTADYNLETQQALNRVANAVPPEQVELGGICAGGDVLITALENYNRRVAEWVMVQLQNGLTDLSSGDITLTAGSDGLWLVAFPRSVCGIVTHHSPGYELYVIDVSAETLSWVGTVGRIWADFADEQIKWNGSEWIMLADTNFTHGGPFGGPYITLRIVYQDGIWQPLGYDEKQFEAQLSTMAPIIELTATGHNVHTWVIRHDLAAECLLGSQHLGALLWIDEQVWRFDGTSYTYASNELTYFYVLGAGELDANWQAYCEAPQPDKPFIDLVVQNETAYIINSEQLQIVDVSVSPPQVLGQVALHAEPYDIEVMGQHVYVGIAHRPGWGSDSALLGGIQIFDVSEATAPMSVVFYQVGESLGDLAVGDNYVFTVGKVIDVTNPALPSAAGTYYATINLEAAGETLTYNPQNKRLYGYRGACQRWCFYGVRVWDVSQPWAATFLNEFEKTFDPAPGGGGSLLLFGDVAQVYAHNVDMVSVGDVNAMSVIGRNIDIDHWRMATKHGARAYAIGYGSNQLDVIDVSNPEQPTTIGTRTLPGGDFVAIVADENNVYLLGRSNGLSVIDMSNAAQ